MPNYCHNNIMCTEDNPVHEFLKNHASTDGLDFQKLIPMPSHLMIESGTINDEYQMDMRELEIVEDVHIDNYDAILTKLMKGKGSGLYKNQVIKNKVESVQIKSTGWTTHGLFKMAIEQAKQMLENAKLKESRIDKARINQYRQYMNMKIYGHPTWYDWCCENWGTKWNSMHGDAYSFDTAWAPPVPIFNRIAELTNGTFYVICREPGDRIYEIHMYDKGRYAVQDLEETLSNKELAKLSIIDEEEYESIMTKEIFQNFLESDICQL